MPTSKSGAITGSYGGGVPDARMIADMITASIGKAAKGVGGVAGGGGTGVTNISVYQTVNQAGGGGGSVFGGADALIRALDNARAGMDQITVAMRQQTEAMARRDQKDAESQADSRQARADAIRRSNAETKAQTKAAEATTRAMRDMQNSGEKATTAAAMDRRMKSQGLDVGEWQRRLEAAGATVPSSLRSLTKRMGVYNDKRATADVKADAYKYVQDNFKQARLDTNRAIATGKMLQAQQKQIDAASQQANELLKNSLFDKNSDEYKQLSNASDLMSKSANWGATQASTLSLRKGVLDGLTQANADASKVVKAAETAAKNAESQYKLLTGNDRFKSLPGQQQMGLGNAYKDFQNNRSAETLKALQAEERAAQNALELQSYISKRGGADMAQRAAQEKMDTTAKRAGGYDRWSAEQKQWYDEAKGYQESLNKSLAKGAVDKATESYGLMNKALDHLNPSLVQSEKTITAANKANDKAAELAATPMSGSARNALFAASGGLDKALNGNDIQAVADATKNLVNVMDTAQKSAEAVAERAKATEKQQAALEKNSYTSPQAIANMQASRDRWLESQDTKDLGKYVASVKSATFGSMSNEMEALGKQLDMLRNPTGSRDNSTSWAAEQKRVLDDLTASRERYNEAVAKGDEAAANRALQDTKSGLSTLKSELNEAQKLQQEIDKVRNNPRMTDSMKQQLDGVVGEWKAVGSGAEDYQRKVNAVRDSLQTMTQTMAQMDVAGKWNQAGTAVEKYTQKLNKASAGNGGDAYWTEYQRGLYKDAQTALGDMKAAQASGDLGAYNTAEKTFNGKLNALNAALMTTRGQMGGMNGQVDALSKSLANLAAPMMLWRRFSGYLKKASQNVSAIDSQMADLKKVTTNTNAEYQQFLTSSGQNAVSIGAKISDLVATTSTFAHMGYSLRDSQALGVTATKFANVGNFQNTTEAADAMIAVIKGFDDLSIGDADIVGDKLTAVANNYAVTANDIAEGLQKSASSLNVAGNNIDQSTAMITAIAEVTRDAGAAGSALKVLSMRIRGAKTE